MSHVHVFQFRKCPKRRRLFFCVPFLVALYKILIIHLHSQFSHSHTVEFEFQSKKFEFLLLKIEEVWLEFRDRI